MEAQRTPREKLFAVRVSTAEAREWRLLAKAERATLSESIRRAMRARAEQMSGSAGSSAAATG